jgi:CRISPR-associated endonuclease Csn1
MKTLGLDLGPNSIGWALVEDNDNVSGRIIACGVRVFPEGVDAFDTAKESSRNEQRRTARMMRRQIRRRARRRKIVTAALIEAGLLPANDVERAKVLELDPYPLRARAVSERLEPFDIGRILYHLNQRRGFLSLKKVSKEKVEKELKAIEKKREKAAEKGETPTDEQDDSKMLAAIEMLQQRMDGRTLGQYLHEQQKAPTQPSPGVPGEGVRAPVRIRTQHTKRAMIEDEFLRAWEHQRKHHPGLLTEQKLFGAVGRLDAQRTRQAIPRDRSKSLLQQFGLHGLVFFQRPIYWPREMIGMCELEKGQRRCHRADRRAQRFRMLQEINNLRFNPAGGGEAGLFPGVTLPGRPTFGFVERPLDAEQRQMLLDAMYKKEKIEFPAIRKLLGLLEGSKFNLERGERASIKGCVTDVLMTKAWPGYAKLDEGMKDQIVRVVIDAERDGPEAEEMLRTRFGLADDAVEALMSVDLPDGYVGFSLVAIDKLMPHLEAGLILMGRDGEDSAMHRAEYLRRDQLQKRMFDQLPPLEAIRSGALADLPNPVVRATMHELRRVVNAIVREHGRPDAVHVEMARSLKMSGEKRKKYNTLINDRWKEREKIEKILSGGESAEDCDGKPILPGIKIAATRDAILKYRLWREQDCRCVYTGESISFAQLYDGSTHIDHILPYSKTLDDSQMNKVVCFRDANDQKGQQSPWEWLAGRDPARLKKIEQWSEGLPFNKRRKLVQQEINTDDFIARQLVDTGYIARLAIEYMKLLMEKDHEVQGRKGTYTADLRHHWGIGEVIADLPDSPAWQEKNDLGPGEKNRADHRHHALDALVIALTNRRTLAAMHQGKEMVNHVDRETGEVVEYQRFVNDIPPPWGLDEQAFRDLVSEKIRSINVSHRVRRGVSGGLHEETNHGPVFERVNGAERKAKRREGEFVVRKAVESLSMNEVEKIRDETIRKIVVKRLEEHGIRIGRGAEKVPPKKMQEAMKDLRMPSGVPIRKVRIVKNELTIRPLREGTAGETWVKPGSTHHLCIFEWTERDKKGKEKRVRDAIFVSMLEAKQRIKEQLKERDRLMKAGEPKEAAAHKAAKSHPIIRRTHPEREDAKFVMSLSGGELVLAKVKGRDEPVLLTFKTAASTRDQIYFAAATDARRASNQKQTFFTTMSLSDARKVTVDPLGRVRWAND